MQDLRRYMSGWTSSLAEVSETVIPQKLREKAAVVPETPEDVETVDALWREVVAWWEGDGKDST